MSIFNHDIYDNVRTRVIVLQDDTIILHPPSRPGDGWKLPGGGIEPNESLAECAAREVLEETGVQVTPLAIAFLREWVVPKYCVMPDSENRSGYGMEVYIYARPIGEDLNLRAEGEGRLRPQWISLHRVRTLPVWPKELKALAQDLLSGRSVCGIPAVLGRLESPLAEADDTEFNPIVR